MPRRRRTLSASELVELEALYAAHVPIREIEATLGLSNKTLYYWLDKLGIPRRGWQRGHKHRNWKGGTRTNGQGYVRVWISPTDPFAVMVPSSEKSYHVLEHRLVMAKSLGRPLRSDETVHHINGNKLDNRLENLQLRIGKHGNGVSLCCADCGSANLVPTQLGEK